MDATEDLMIRLQGVGKTYAGGTVAVQELDLDVPRGELVTLVGPSGCGKSTTLKMINRLIEPTTGHDRAGRQGRHEHQRRRAASPHRLRHPADRVVPPPDHPRQRRDAAQAARLGPQAQQRTRRRAARDDGPRPQDLRRPLPGSAVRWSASARRRRAGARGRPRRAAHGRAVRCRRPDRAEHGSRTSSSTSRRRSRRPSCSSPTTSRRRSGSATGWPSSSPAVGWRSSTRPPVSSAIPPTTSWRSSSAPTGACGGSP